MPRPNILLLFTDQQRADTLLADPDALLLIQDAEWARASGDPAEF